MRTDNNLDVKYREFGLRVREARKNRKLTMRELSEKINITENFLARIESNNGKAGIGTIIKICNELKVSMDFLFQDSLFDMDADTLDVEALSEPDKNFIINTVKNLKQYRDELNGMN
jgi:transcriptional regulator with XRE-family HTH domain